MWKKILNLQSPKEQKNLIPFLRPILRTVQGGLVFKIVKFVSIEKDTGGRLVVNTLARHSVVRGSLAIPKFESRLGQFIN